LHKLSLLQKLAKAKIVIISTISSNEKRAGKKETGYKPIELTRKDMFCEVFVYVNIVPNSM